MHTNYILAAARQLETEIPSLHSGICTNLQLIDPIISYTELEVIFEKMGLNRLYPVEGGGEAYRAAKSTGQLWDRATPYGRLRFQLLSDMIKYLDRPPYSWSE